MSLVGNLEDLSLGDILQIISLSQKSGVLTVQSDSGAGRIVFVGGLVRGAAVEGGPQDLHGVLVGGGFLDDSAFEVGLEAGEREGLDPMAALDAHTELTSERVDSLCREAVEAAVADMFTWRKGDFSFDVRTQPIEGDPSLLLPTGVNAQYLAMEAARHRDEKNFGGLDTDELDLDDAFESTASPASDTAAFDDMDAQAMFGAVPDEDATDPGPAAAAVDGDDVISAADAVAMATLERVEAAFGEGSPPVETSSPLAPGDTQKFDEPICTNDADFMELDEADVIETFLPDSDTFFTEDALEAVPQSQSEPAAAPLSGERPESGVEVAPPNSDTASLDGLDWDAWADRPVVIVDASLPMLEWAKSHLKDRFSHVHIFQRSDQGLSRIRQYLVRGIAPILVLSPEIRVDQLSGIRDARDFVDRLEAQSRKLTAIWLATADAKAVPRGRRKGPSLERPGEAVFRARSSGEELDELGGAFCQRLGEILRVESKADTEGGGAGEAQASAQMLTRLRDTTRQLTDASSGGEILPLVIRFATDLFERVAMFMVRADVAEGIAQVGLDRAGGPNDAGFQSVRMPVGESAWLRQVLEERRPLSSAPSDEGDRKLVSLLGERGPRNAYLAPIESAGQVVALLYADNLPDGRPFEDTSALEVVLHHAGLALDRAALERALQE